MSLTADHVAAMRILFLSKRRYMSKDVILDRYARMYEFPYQLAKRGHVVLCCSLSYRFASEGRWTHNAAPGNLEWRSWNLGRSVVPGLLRFSQQSTAQARIFKPDLIVGASDIPHCVFARHLANRLKVPYAIDLYDNFESFGQARIPGAVAGLRRAARGASFISCVSEPLATHVRQYYGASCPVLTLESTVDKAFFQPRDRAACRAKLGLPPGAKLIGTAGSLSAEKGIEALYRAFELLAARDPDVHLVLAGPVEAATPPPQGPRVHLLGQLPHAEVATLFSALDVAMICIRDTPFGRYCFPQKAYEMLACGTPVVAADIGAMKTLLQPFPASLYRAENAEDLAASVARQLERPTLAAVPIKGWDELAAELEQGLMEAVRSGKRLH